MGGGLGGGSSDAATVPAGAQPPLGGVSLGAWRKSGSTLGADVPFFLSAATPWRRASARITPVDLPAAWFALVKPPSRFPPRKSSTASLTRQANDSQSRPFCAGFGHNDLEAGGDARYPEVGAALDWLGQHCEARMTGSGGVSFAEFENRDGS